jgi:hypothetical protein
MLLDAARWHWYTGKLNLYDRTWSILIFWSKNEGSNPTTTWYWKKLLADKKVVNTNWNWYRYCVLSSNRTSLNPEPLLLVLIASQFSLTGQPTLNLRLRFHYQIVEKLASKLELPLRKSIVLRWVIIFLLIIVFLTKILKILKCDTS